MQNPANPGTQKEKLRLMKAIRMTRTGGPEVLEYVDVPDPVPGAGDVLVDVEHIGINFIDTYVRRGAYPRPLR